MTTIALRGRYITNLQLPCAFTSIPLVAMSFIGPLLKWLGTKLSKIQWLNSKNSLRSGSSVLRMFTARVVYLQNKGRHQPKSSLCPSLMWCSPSPEHQSVGRSKNGEKSSLPGLNWGPFDYKSNALPLSQESNTSFCSCCVCFPPKITYTILLLPFQIHLIKYSTLHFQFLTTSTFNYIKLLPTTY